MKNKIFYMQAQTYVQFLVRIDLKKIEYDFDGRVYYKGNRIKIEEKIPFNQVVVVDKKDMSLSIVDVYELIQEINEIC